MILVFRVQVGWDICMITFFTDIGCEGCFRLDRIQIKCSVAGFVYRLFEDLPYVYCKC